MSEPSLSGPSPCPRSSFNASLDSQTSISASSGTTAWWWRPSLGSPQPPFRLSGHLKLTRPSYLSQLDPRCFSGVMLLSSPVTLALAAPSPFSNVTSGGPPWKLTPGPMCGPALCVPTARPHTDLLQVSSDLSPSLVIYGYTLP